VATWEERVSSHPVKDALKGLEDALVDAEEQAKADPDAWSMLQRIKSVLNYTTNHIKQVEPNLTSLALLTSIGQNATAVAAELRGFVTRKKIAHLEAANNTIEALIHNVSTLPTVATRADLRSLVADIDSFRSAVGESLGHWKSKAAALSQKYSEASTTVEGLTVEIASQKGLLSQAITQYQATFSQSEESRQAQFIAAQQARAEDSDKAVAARRDQFNALLDEQRKAFALTHEELTGAFRAAMDETENSAAKRLSTIEAARNQAESLLGVIGNTGVVSGFNRVADQEQKTARVWAVIAVLAFVGLITTACIAFFSRPNGTFSWGAFAGRVYVSLTFGLLAAFAAYMSEQHFAVERRARRLEIELASLGPFISEFPAQERNELKRLLVDRIFGQQEALQPGQERVTTGTVKDLLELAAKLMNKR